MNYPRNESSKTEAAFMAELLDRGKELLGLTKKKGRKDCHYEYGRDPVSGFRNNKGTYQGQPKKRRKEISFALETPGFESDGTVAASCFAISDYLLVL